MKVMCIEDRFFDRKNPCPVFGEITTVMSSFTAPNGNPVYIFAEYPSPWYGLRVFSQKYFAPLSDIDETELINQKEKAA